MPFDVFISYVHKDRKLRDELAVHLSNLRNQHVISDWYDGDLIPGTEWEPDILAHLRTARIILLLISAHFMASPFCRDIEMQEAIARHQARQARVIPILLRPTDWQDGVTIISIPLANPLTDHAWSSCALNRLGTHKLFKSRAPCLRVRLFHQPSSYANQIQ